MNPNNPFSRSELLKEILTEAIRSMVSTTCATCGCKVQPDQIVRDECPNCRKR